MHGKAKEQAGIDSEKEIIETSTIQAMGKNKYGNVTQKELEEKLNSNEGEGKTEVIDDENTLIVKFIESNRYYEVDSAGNVSEPIEIIVDEYAGDLTKGGKCDGSETNPYEISCIEDLVVFSMMTNGGNSELGINSSNFSGKYVILDRDLDFNSIFSYNDYNSTKYGDLNTDGIVENIKKELTKTDEGCVGFTAISSFAGTFDGKENMIKNIYQKVDGGNIALFVYATNVIKNVNLSGTIINTEWHAAGICSLLDYREISIINCKNYANITGYNMVGGICDITRTGNTTISNCENYGTITKTGSSWQYSGVGGIVGYVDGNMTIEKCINNGEIIGSTNAGIVGCSNGVDIKKCMNKGKSVAGILGWARYGNINVINCYNLGECVNGIVDSFSGCDWNKVMELNIKNCYNLGKVTNSGIIGIQGNTAKEITLNIENCYNAGDSSKAILGSISYSDRTTTTTNISNTYYDTSKSSSVGVVADGITGLSESEMKNNDTFVETLNNNIGDNSEWERWKIGENGYPTFE